MTALTPERAASPPAPARSIGRLSELQGFRFRRIQNHLSRRLMESPGFDASKPGELSALAILKANPGLSQVELSEELGLDKAMIVVIIDDLEKRGLARRERALDDRRRNLLYITPEGERVMTRWFKVALDIERPLREALTPDEFKLLSGLLDRVYDQCFHRVDG
jgi:DNA-binding MarR family transcriptional regulator